MDDIDSRDAGETQVEYHGVGEVFDRETQCVLAGGREVDLIPTRPKVGGQRAEHLRLVVDAEDPVHTGLRAGALTTGTVSTAVSPPPGVSSSSSRPPIAPVSPSAMASPRPRPPDAALSPRR